MQKAADSKFVHPNPRILEGGGPALENAEFKVVINLEMLHSVGYFSPSKNSSQSGFSKLQSLTPIV